MVHMTQKRITKSTPLNKIIELTPACSCSACSHGCTMGSGCLVDGDVEKIAQFMGVTENEFKQKYLEEMELFNKKMLRPKIQRGSKPYGQCIFYDGKKGCTIHEVKPLQCKISMGCKSYSSALTSWFVLNYVLNTSDPEAIRQYASFVASGGEVIPGGALAQLMPNAAMRKKIMNYEVLK